MGERINRTALIGRAVLIMLLLGGAGSAVRAQVASEPDLQVLMAEAQQGVAEAQYRLGQHYETQYDLERGDPEVATDHTNLLLAYAWFQSAEASGHQDARYARIATEFALKVVFDDDEFRQAMESVQEWMADQSPQPSATASVPAPAQPAVEAVAQPVAAAPSEATAEAPDETPNELTAAAAPAATAEAPPEAATELAAGDEDHGAGPVMAPPPEPDPVVAMAPAPVRGPDIEALLARGNAFLEIGDLVSARGFFKLAAGRGSGEAAMLVGVTYDPGYMELTNVVGLRPNPEQAEAWYMKAIEMNNQEAETRLRALKRRLGQGP